MAQSLLDLKSLSQLEHRIVARSPVPHIVPLDSEVCQVEPGSSHSQHVDELVRCQAHPHALLRSEAVMQCLEDWGEPSGPRSVDRDCFLELARLGRLPVLHQPVDDRPVTEAGRRIRGEEVLLRERQQLPRSQVGDEADDQCQCSPGPALVEHVASEWRDHPLRARSALDSDMEPPRW